MSHTRYYSKKDYKGDFSAFGTAIVFTLIGILSLAFRTYGISFIGLSNWGYWFFIPAFFTFISAFSHLYSDRRMRNNVFTSVSNRSGRVKLESLSQETGISPKNLLRILIDLRASKGIKYSFVPLILFLPYPKNKQRQFSLLVKLLIVLIVDIKLPLMFSFAKTVARN